MRKRIVSLAIYAVAMAYVEAMVVVYLRRLVPLEVLKKKDRQDKRLCGSI